MERKSINSKIATFLMMLLLLMLSTQVVSARDLSGNWDKGQKLRVNKMTTGKFEKKNDSDCYYFKSNGGKYTLYLYSKKAVNNPYLTKEEIKQWKEWGLDYKVLPINFDYSGFELFSAYPGQKPTSQPGAIMSRVTIDAKATGDGWYRAKISLKRFKKNQKVAIMLTGQLKEDYKFILLDKNGKLPKTYTIKYNLNGGSGSISNQKKEQGSTIKLSSKKPKKEGYTFMGWSVKKNGSVKYKAGAKYKANSNVTLYAKWKRKPHLYGLAIGGWNTADDIYNISSAGNDAKKLRTLFLKNKMDGTYISKGTFKLHTPDGAPTRAQIDSWIKEAFKDAKSTDTCYFLYAGHGMAGVSGYTPLYDENDPEKVIGCKNLVYDGIGIVVNPTSTSKSDYYSYTDLVSTLDKNCKGHVVMIVATCHSGGFAKAAKGNSKFTVITGCSQKETLGNTVVDYTANSGEDLGVIPGLAAFFGPKVGIDPGYNDLVYYINKGMTGKHPMDANNDKKITEEEFYNYVSTNLQKKTNRHPQFYSSKSSRTIFQY